MDWPKALSCLSRGRFHFIKWKFNRRARLDVPFLHVQGEEISVSTRRGMTSWLINMPPCSSFKLKTCPDLLEPSPLGNTDSHRFHAEAVWFSRDIAKRFQSSGPSTTQLADVQRVRATVSNTMEVLRFRSLISNPVHGAFNYSSRLAGVSWPQTCSSSLLIKVFVSERSSVNVSTLVTIWMFVTIEGSGNTQGRSQLKIWKYILDVLSICYHFYHFSYFEADRELLPGKWSWPKQVICFIPVHTIEKNVITFEK